MGNTELRAAQKGLHSRQAYRCVFPPFASTSALVPIQRPAGLAPKSDNTLSANKSVGARAVTYAGIYLRGLMPYTYKQREFYRSFVAFT